MFLQYCVIFLVVSIIAEEIVQKTDNGLVESGRNLNDYFTETADISGWMPQYHTDELAPPLLRRRIRKRKRRPPVITLISDDSEIPIRTDEMVEKIRRKSAPIYDEDNRQVSQKIRDPFTALKEAESKQKATFEEFTTMPTTTKTIDLKTILKQSGGVSLSEILQRKNLTLSELLMGNRAAISALIEKTPTTEAIPTIRYGNDGIIAAKYRKIPSNLQNTINRNYEQTSESVESFEVLDAQRKRLASLHESKDNQIYRDVTKFEVVTDETTERRVFIPQFDRKVSTEIPIKPKFRSNLPVTSAKLNRLISNKPSTIPPNAIKININDIFGYHDLKKHSDNGPFRMTIDIDDMFENTLKSSKTEEKEPQIDDSSGVKLKPVTAKDEIMEILKNPNDRENLSKILRIRNMTIDELVQQRERGSSQLHLADIFHNQTREPEPEGEISVSYITQEYFDNFPASRQGKNQRFSSVVKKELKNPEKIETTTTTTTTSTTTTTTQPLYTITNFPTYKIESNKNLLGNNQENQPFLGRIWRELYTDINADFYKNNHQKTDRITAPISTTPPIFNDFDDNSNNLQETDKFDRTFTDINDLEGDDDFFILPSRVKSAILASLAIIGGSIFVFLTILMIFKWNQKQKTRLDYNGSFSRSKLRTAILESQQKHRSLKNFMNETLGRKKNYYKAHLHNMSDSIWDNDQKATF